MGAEVPQRMPQPAYPLSEIAALAAQGKVSYAGTRVGRNAAEIGMSLDDVCACLSQLKESQFDVSLHFPRRAPLDVYLVKGFVCADETRDLYVKFKLLGDRLSIFLCSFHPEGWTDE